MPTKDGKFSGVSSEAVLAATGRSWDKWLDFLDQLGGAEMSYKEIVALAA